MKVPVERMLTDFYSYSASTSKEHQLRRPCACIMPSDTSSLSMHAYPLMEQNKAMLVASSIQKGHILRIQVSKDFDGCLFLGAILGVIVLEPKLLQVAG